ncbi:MAG: hypothetical protein NZM07_07045 [Elioraea sp.]|nr:hypothetical protein [Elioraea sp.]
MNRTVMALLAALAASLGAAGTASAGAYDEITRMQKNGMWELRPPAGKGKPVLFCVTDSTKIGALDTMREVVGDMCKTEKDSLRGDQYEIVMACSSKDPDVGNFRMVMKGTARPDYQTGTTTVSGGGKMIQMLFPTGNEGGGEFRWLRPCKAGEKPGPQGS